MLAKRFIEWTNQWNPIFFIHCTHPMFGNRAEEIYFGLLKARRERRRVFFLKPWKLPWILAYPKGNQALLDLESEYRFLRKNGVLSFILNQVVNILIFPERTFAIIKYTFFKKPLEMEAYEHHIGVGALWCPEGTKQFTSVVADAIHWQDQLSKPLEISFSNSVSARCAEQLLELGIEKGKWFVCVHVREGGFHQDDLENVKRNASIDQYKKAFEFITQHGGLVVRLGDRTMKPLKPMSGVIDYPFSNFKNEFLDIYLVEKCRFYLGMLTGPLDVAMMFQKPILLTNAYVYKAWYLFKKGDLGLLKHFYSKKRKKFLSITEVLEDEVSVNDLNGFNADYETFENTSDEILDLVKEYFDFLSLGDVYTLNEDQEEYNKLRIAKIKVNLEDSKAKRTHKDIIQNYRLASRYQVANGSLGKNFLKASLYSSSFEGDKSLNSL